ncbi:hypothetical protein CJP72_07240 [Citrobacter sp. NCU1]|nr:hypothetical protein [Citrobacter sp. NCU1]
MMKFTPRNPLSKPRYGLNANVLFPLNLPPKLTLNHKVKLTITLAYAKIWQSRPQNKKPKIPLTHP